MPEKTVGDLQPHLLADRPVTADLPVVADAGSALLAEVNRARVRRRMAVSGSHG